jgi:hypothetical protein
LEIQTEIPKNLKKKEADEGIQTKIQKSQTKNITFFLDFSFS